MSQHPAPEPAHNPDELVRADHRREQRLLWKGLLALLVVLVVVVIRQWYFL